MLLCLFRKNECGPGGTLIFSFVNKFAVKAKTVFTVIKNIFCEKKYIYIYLTGIVSVGLLLDLYGGLLPILIIFAVSLH